jgi:hypothetical protein
LHFTNEIISTVVGHELYTFLDRFLGYHQISIAPKDQQNRLCDKLRGFCVGYDAIWCQKWIAHLSKGHN